MSKILVIESEPLICEVVTTCFQEWTDATVEHALNAHLGARKLRQLRYDLAIIGGKLLELSGAALAEIAANENIPVLILSGHPGLLHDLRTFGYPCLEKPFSPLQLLAESRRVIAKSGETIRRVKATADKMRANTEALRSAVEETQRLLRKIAERR